MEKVAVSHLYPKEFRASEALKTLRTNLVFSGPSVRAIGITSFGAAAGKSTVSMQIALAFAQTGKRVLLVDADMRKSVLPTRLRVKGIDHHFGFTRTFCAVNNFNHKKSSRELYLTPNRKKVFTIGFILFYHIFYIISRVTTKKISKKRKFFQIS